MPMPSIEVPDTSAALTADGDATGYATITSTTGWFAGAKGFIRNNSSAKRVIITEIKDATHIGLRFIADDAEQQGAVQVYGGRSDLTGFTVASSSRLYMERQLVRVEPQYTSILKPNV